MTWTQNYDLLGPVGSSLIAALPIVLLLSLLATGRVPAPVAAAVSLAVAVLAAVFAFTPKEVQAGDGGIGVWAVAILAAAGNGAAFGLFPIGWIVLTAIFLYTLTVETGQFEIVKHSVMALSDDRRLQALLIAFCFGAFVEGAAGFGTPVAISAALMVGAGFRPLQAAGLALIANTSPVAFGALGTPILTLANITGLPEQDLSAMAGRQLPFFSLLVPVVLVWTLAGWRATLAVWPALLVCGGSFAVVQFAVANYHGPWLVDVAGGLVSLAALAWFLKFWHPRETWHFAGEIASPSPPSQNGATAAIAPGYTRRQIMAAWAPWTLLTVFVFLWGVPQVKEVLGVPSAAQRQAFDDGPDLLAVRPTVICIKVPGLHRQVARDQPVVDRRETEKAVYEVNWLSATGTGILLAAAVSAWWLRIGIRRFGTILLVTCQRMLWPLVTIACMLAIAFTTRYSGMDAALGLVFTRAGWIYPFFAALLGWLGVALTGSDTSSNALFGSLQTITARRLVHQGFLNLSDQQAMILLATANSTGGVMGKMIDAQSIVVSAAATQQPGQEGAILRYVFWHSLILAALMGALVMVQAHLWKGVIP